VRPLDGGSCGTAVHGRPITPPSARPRLNRHGRKPHGAALMTDPDQSPHRTATPPTAPGRQVLLPDQAATERFATAFARLARPGDAFLLHGPLGAGKSTFARAFLRASLSDPGLEVPSPTFTLVQTYPRPDGTQIAHYDLWRLAAPHDLAELGWEDSQPGIVLVEWPDRLGALAPTTGLVMHFSLVPGAPEARDLRLEWTSGWRQRILSEAFLAAALTGATP